MAKTNKNKTPARSFGKHPGGRPSEYSKDILKATKKYIDNCEDQYLPFGKIIVRLPSIEGLALFLDVARQTLRDWGEQHTEFSATLEKLRAKQAQKLIDNGLSSDYNPTIAKLILSTNHGYVEKSENKNENIHSLKALLEEAAKH